MARIYHARGLAWPGELKFYLDLASQAITQLRPVLEIACGTGRIAIPLAQAGASLTGLDISAPMLDVARANAAGIPNLRFVQADMCDFNLDEVFSLIISPGHSFQHLLTIDDQLDCLACLRRHLHPGGLLVLHIDHQDFSWLGDLRRDLGGVFRPAEEVIDSHTGHLVRTQRAWWYQPSTQTATSLTRWQVLDGAGQSLDQWEVGPVRFHCFFRFEMQHLLHRAGFQVEATYGDFHCGELNDASTDMIWLARLPYS
jgi:SAM-dependent methyltransferase